MIIGNLVFKQEGTLKGKTQRRSFGHHDSYSRDSFQLKDQEMQAREPQMEAKTLLIASIQKNEEVETLPT